LNGGVHLYLWEHAYREIRIIGPLLLLNAVAALLIAIALLWKPASPGSRGPKRLVAPGFNRSAK